MSRAISKTPFATRPSAADAWVKASDRQGSEPNRYTARLTIDVTPALRGRIKVTAFERGQTVADMLRALLEREYGGGTDKASTS